MSQTNNTDPIFRAELTTSLNYRRSTQYPRLGNICTYNLKSIARATKQSSTNYIDFIRQVARFWINVYSKQHIHEPHIIRLFVFCVG